MALNLLTDVALLCTRVQLFVTLPIKGSAHDFKKKCSCIENELGTGVLVFVKGENQAKRA